MKGYIYIAGSFLNTEPSKCGSQKEWIDNDPHIHSKPYTWGICRYDLRTGVEEGDYVFFVLPKASKQPRMIFAYLKVGKIMSHKAAYHAPELRDKRMTANRNPNGNIIDNGQGEHSPYDGHNYNKIKERYVIANMSDSKKFNPEFMATKSKNFPKALNKILEIDSDNLSKLISRKGRKLNSVQVNELLNWLGKDSKR
ncbi:hypothetical protein HYU15_00925 [Candidatus Woesearchaeota archaeon]|nr:hypothetical protein [Candidatus Woesearchaeota archaeon]